MLGGREEEGEGEEKEAKLKGREEKSASSCRGKHDTETVRKREVRGWGRVGGRRESARERKFASV